MGVPSDCAKAMMSPVFPTRNIRNKRCLRSALLIIGLPFISVASWLHKAGCFLVVNQTSGFSAIALIASPPLLNPKATAHFSLSSAL